MFDEYRNRLGYYGTSDIDCIRAQNVAAKESNFTLTMSYCPILIDGVLYDARLTEDVSDTVKTGNGNFKVEFRDDVIFHPGTYAQIQNVFGEWEYWMLIDVLDGPMTPKTLIKKCAYKIAWKNYNGNIIQRWICFNDSYKLDSGTRNYGYQTNLPYTSIVIMIAADEDTINIRRGQRFIIDAPDTVDPPDVWSVTNRSVGPRYHDGYGILTLVLDQDYFNFETDNAELMIADYYVVPDPIKEEATPGVARAEISYNGQSKIVAGAGSKEYHAKFYDAFNRELTNVEAIWNVKILSELEQFFTVEVDGNSVSIAAENNENVYNYTLYLTVTSNTGNISKDIPIKVVSGI